MKESSSTEKALVLGASGRLGQLAVRHLHARGLAIRAACRDPRAAAELFRGLAAVEIVPVDLARKDGLDTIVSGCTSTIFAAGASRPCYSRRPEDVEEFQRINVEALRNVAGAVLRAGNHPLVHFGSLLAFGICQSGELTETTDHLPESPFEHSEHEGELTLLELFRTDGLDCRIMRLAPVIGAGPPRGILAEVQAAATQAKWKSSFDRLALTTKPLITLADFLSGLDQLLKLGKPGMASIFASGNYQLAQFPALLDQPGTNFPSFTPVTTDGQRHPDLDRFLAAYLALDVTVRLDLAAKELAWTPADATSLRVQQ